MYSKSKIYLVFFLLAAIFFIAGCETKQLAADLSQRQANEIANLLFSNSITADLEKAGTGSKSKYTVVVSDKDYRTALSLIQQNGLPKEDQLSVEEIINSEGFFPQNREIELLKLERAYASEIEKLVKSYHGILTVSAVVRKSAVSENANSIAIVIESEDPAAISIDEITSMAMKVVPDTQKANVVVSVQPVKINVRNSASNSGLSSFLGFARVLESDQKKLSLIVTILLLMFCLAGGIIGYYLGLGQKVKNNSSARIGSERKDLIGVNEDNFLI